MFFRRPGTRKSLTEGDIFQRRVAHDLIETARVKAVTTGPLGIQHVTFRVSTPGIEDRGDQRILAADVFAQMYQPS